MTPEKLFEEKEYLVIAAIKQRFEVSQEQDKLQKGTIWSWTI